jgi:pyridinium-3,5-bisthiocarboxylic acid mononucleotide nickel chelatase
MSSNPANPEVLGPLPQSRVAWFQCGAGVAGDMTLAALVDAGADTDLIAAAIAGLGIDHYALHFERVQRCGVGATWTNLVIHHDREHQHGEHQHRPAKEVLELIEAADLAPRVKRRALITYRVLAEVEAKVHGVPWEQVELHEVGAVDSIIDVVGVCAALESLDIDAVYCSPIAVGHGTVRTAHGELPNPVPAVAHLLAQYSAPVVGLDTTMEVSTPTGVALMTSLTAEGTGENGHDVANRKAARFGAMPAMRVTAIGYGAGTADPPHRPNVVQVMIGEIAPSLSTAPGVDHPGIHSADSQPIMQVEANVDDVSGEILAHTISRLLAAGAVDAWATPIVMKKGRPAHTVAALCHEVDLAHVGQVLITETGTLGIRAHRMERWPQPRTESTVEVDGHLIRIKRGAGRFKVENDDAVAAASALGLSLREVLRRAEAQAANQ